MGHEDYLKEEKWFAWRPVKLTNFKWVWLKTVNRIIDGRPEVYLGLQTEYKYSL